MDLLSLIVSETAEYAGVSVCCSGGSIGGRRVQRATLFPRSNVDVMMQSREYVTKLYFLAALSLKKKKGSFPRDKVDFVDVVDVRWRHSSASANV